MNAWMCDRCRAVSNGGNVDDPPDNWARPVWMCDRCRAVSNGGNVDDPPDNWARRKLPVRGSEGGRFSREAVICDQCDDSLYEWCRSSP